MALRLFVTVIRSAKTGWRHVFAALRLNFLRGIAVSNTFSRKEDSRMRRAASYHEQGDRRPLGFGWGEASSIGRPWIAPKLTEQAGVSASANPSEQGSAGVASRALVKQPSCAAAGRVRVARATRSDAIPGRPIARRLSFL